MLLIIIWVCVSWPKLLLGKNQECCVYLCSYLIPVGLSKNVKSMKYIPCRASETCGPCDSQTSLGLSWASEPWCMCMPVSVCTSCPGALCLPYTPSPAQLTLPLAFPS